MPNPQQTKPLDESKLNTFIGQILSDLGGASSVPLVRPGHHSRSVVLDAISFNPRSPEARSFIRRSRKGHA
jgi:hypothetical protein